MKKRKESVANLFVRETDLCAEYQLVLRNNNKTRKNSLQFVINGYYQNTQTSVAIAGLERRVNKPFFTLWQQAATIQITRCAPSIVFFRATYTQ